MGWVSVIRYTPKSVSGKDILLFSNPNHENKRLNMSVKLSYDGGGTWPVVKTLHEGPTAYSCLTVLQDGRIACFYEAGQNNPYEKITLATFTLDWLCKAD